MDRNNAARASPSATRRASPNRFQRGREPVGQAVAADTGTRAPALGAVKYRSTQPIWPPADVVTEKRLCMLVVRLITTLAPGCRSKVNSDDEQKLEQSRTTTGAPVSFTIETGKTWIRRQSTTAAQRQQQASDLHHGRLAKRRPAATRSCRGRLAQWETKDEAVATRPRWADGREAGRTERRRRGAGLRRAGCPGRDSAASRSARSRARAVESPAGRA